jgi:ribosomal-protein-alanine N-acetyltransferase
MPDINVQLADESCLDEIMAIETRAYIIPWSRQQFLDCLTAGYKLYIVRDDSESIIGYWVIQLILDELHLLNICVAPDKQGQGLGSLFLTQIISQGSEAGCNRLLLEVRRDNKAARRLYQNKDFERIGIRKGYYPGKEGTRVDAIVMEYLFE